MLGISHTNVMLKLNNTKGVNPVTKQQIYDTIVSLTAEIKTTDVGLKLFEAAKTSGRKVEEISETFMKEHAILYQKMTTFVNEYTELINKSEDGTDVEIFGPIKDEENEIFTLDPEIIDAPSFFAFTFLTDIDASSLFTTEYIDIDAADDEYVTSDSAYLDAIEKESGSSDLANFLGIAFFSEEELECLEDHGLKYLNIYDLLADVFAGKLKEYVE